MAQTVTHSDNLAKTNPQTSPKLAYRINQAAYVLGLSRSTIYRLVADRELDLVKLSERASGITRASIARMAEARSIPLPEGF